MTDAFDLSASLDALPSGSPASEVARRLLDLFTRGDIVPGTRLPPERQLAVTLEIGRSAVREALAALEILGILDVRPGPGAYLRGSASDLLPQTLRWGLLIGEISRISPRSGSARRRERPRRDPGARHRSRGGRGE